MQSRRILSLAGAALLASAGAANAGLIIVPGASPGGVRATSEATLDGGPGFPLNIYGYTSPAVLEATDSGLYQFTFEGAGTAANTNMFIAGSHTFTAFGPGGTTAGSTAPGTSFELFLTANTPIAFTFGSSGGCAISDGATTTGGCNYLVALANSLSAPGATGPRTTAWLGFSDSANDADFQDMVVRVNQIPEPMSVALFGAGLVALGLSRRRKTA